MRGSGGKGMRKRVKEGGEAMLGRRVRDRERVRGRERRG